jgi:Cu(I)/Ag(I) efflux system membrane fusion protein
MHSAGTLPALAVFAAVLAASAGAQSVREHTRLPPGPTSVTEAQASELTLTLTDVSVRPIQIWVRTAGTINEARRVITADVPAHQGHRLRVGQRIRVFSPESRTRMYQATLSQLKPGEEAVTVTAALMGRTLETGRYYVLEIVTEEGEFLSVPNEAIIETGGRKLVYVREAEGSYAPREIQPGAQGELFTQVVDGLKAGEQVVTIGSFFIDADQKLKGF